jgi:phage FluMu protein Com
MKHKGLAVHNKKRDVKIGPRKRSVSQEDCLHKTAAVTPNHYLGAKCPRCGKQGHFTSLSPGNVDWHEELDGHGKKREVMSEDE